MVSLALGIGANTTILTLINAVFLRPLPVRDPERLVQVFTVMPKSAAYQSLSLANYRDFRDFVPELSGLAAWRGVGVNMVGGTEPLAIGGQLVTGNYFELLGVEAARGRTFTPDEDKTAGELLSLFVPCDGILPGYLSAVGIPILEGRDFTDADREGAGQVAIVNETTAKLYWPGQDPIGKRFKHRLNPNYYTVVGVARDAQYQGIGAGPQPRLYYPALQYHTPAMTLAVRTSGDPEPVLPMVGQVIKQLDGSMPRPLYQR